MPDNQNQGAQSNPFEIVTSGKSKKVGSKGLIITLVIVVFLALGIFAGVLLVRQRQEIREKASGTCASGYTKNVLRECKKNCVNQNQVGDDWYWMSSSDGSCGTGSEGEPKVWCDIVECVKNESASIDFQTDENNCGAVGAVCGTGKICVEGQCIASVQSTPTPTATATATSTSSASPTATATATATGSGVGGALKTPTPTPTKTSTSTAKATATSTSAATKAPIPETGTSWPTYAGMALGILVIVGALLLAL